MAGSLWDIIASGGFPEDGPNVLDYSNDTLAGLEKRITGALGVQDVLDFASSAGEAYGDASRGKGDALRHVLLSAELQRTHPMLAAPLLFGHEFVTNMLQGQRADDRDMDLKNNAIGRDIGRRAKSREEVERMARDVVENGGVAILPQLRPGEY